MLGVLSEVVSAGEINIEMRYFLKSILFLLIQVFSLVMVWYFNRPDKKKGAKKDAPKQIKEEHIATLNEREILRMEFEYARVTATEAIRDRQTMMNYYLIVVGIISAGVTGVLKNGTKSIGILLLWVLCGVGWFYFLKLIRLREAWYESAKAMNKIKDFFIEHSENSDSLSSAFRWRTDTLPAPGKPWTIYFLSAMLIGFLDSIAYAVGGMLLSANITEQKVIVVKDQTMLVMFILGLALFAFHAVLYFAFLGWNRSNSKTISNDNSEDNIEIKIRVK